MAEIGAAAWAAAVREETTMLVTILAGVTHDTLEEQT